MKEKEREEETALKSHSFKPDCTKRSLDKNLVSAFGADIVDRNEKWAQRKEEKIQRLKQDQEQSMYAACSFKPNTVTFADQTRYEKPDEDDDSHYYSSVFVKDGIKNYFTRLEQARRMKKEAQSRLENWGRDKSKSVKKQTENQPFLDISNISKFDQTARNNHQWETPGTNKEGYSSRPSRKDSLNGYSSKKRQLQPSQQDVDRTVAILRENLKKIQIHLA